MCVNVHIVFLSPEASVITAKKNVIEKFRELNEDIDALKTGNEQRKTRTTLRQFPVSTTRGGKIKYNRKRQKQSAFLANLLDEDSNQSTN